MAENYIMTPEDIEELGLKEIDPSSIDYSELAEYRTKNRFIDTQHDFEVSRVYLRDFISELFDRPMNGEANFEPFEERMCDAYVKWADERNNNLPHDYSENQFTYNPIVFYKSPRAKKGEMKGDGTNTTDRNTHKQIFKEDWKNDSWLEHRYFALTSPITYVGNRSTHKNARMLYAFAVDLDDVGPEQIQILWNGFLRPLNHAKYEGLGLTLIPVPNLIVSSGHGLHLYYILRHPIALYQSNIRFLQYISQLLYDLTFYPTKKNVTGTSRQEKYRCHGIFHSFRLPGTRTKPLCKDKETKAAVGIGAYIEAWKFDERDFWTLGEFVKYWAMEKKMLEKFTPKVIAELERGGWLHNPKRLTRAQALKKYGKLLEPGEPKGHWVTKRALYDSWLERLRKPQTGGVKYGHRYYCVLVLVANAMKCGVPYEELKRDAISVIPELNALSPDASKAFKKGDVLHALEAYGREELIRWRLEMIAAISGVKLKRVKRNKRKLKVHLGICRATRDLLALEKGKENWWEGAGRPVGSIATLDNSKVAIKIKDWREQHPDSHNKSECARELGLSRTTVIKWWKMLDETGEKPAKEATMSFEDIRKQFMEEMEPVRAQYQMELTADEMMSALTNPDDPNHNAIVYEKISE
ncbi:MAG: hypothetical protein IJ895_07175 [Prevotella sp.]|nr:hypothetical protein [Prevotella sp.]